MTQDRPVLLPDEFARYVSALVVLVQRAGGTVEIKDYAAAMKAVGELNSHYDAATDTLTVTYRMRPRPDAWKWN